jgi:hypothetical protein
MRPARLGEVLAEVAKGSDLAVVCLTEDGPKGQLEVVAPEKLAAMVARRGVSSVYVTAGDPPTSPDDFDFREAHDDVAFTLGAADDTSRTIGSSGATATPGGGGMKLLQEIEKCVARRSHRGVRYTQGDKSAAIKPYYWDKTLEEWDLRGYEKLYLDDATSEKTRKASAGRAKKPATKKPARSKKRSA